MNKTKDESGVFLVEGKFEVYDDRGRLRTSNFCIKECFPASFAALARRMGILEAQKRAEKRCGSGTRIRKIGEITAKPAPAHKLIEKNKRKERKVNKKRQGKLY
jgi:hypothetical protein